MSLTTRSTRARSSPLAFVGMVLAVSASWRSGTERGAGGGGFGFASGIPFASIWKLMSSLSDGDAAGLDLKPAEPMFLIGNVITKIYKTAVTYFWLEIKRREIFFRFLKNYFKCRVGGTWPLWGGHAGRLRPYHRKPHLLYLAVGLSTSSAPSGTLRSGSGVVGSS